MVVEVRAATWRGGESLSFRDVFCLSPVLSRKMLTVTKERQEQVIAECEKADPHHGPVWQATAKDLANVGKSTRELLELVAAEVA